MIVVVPDGMGTCSATTSFAALVWVRINLVKVNVEGRKTWTFDL